MEKLWNQSLNQSLIRQKGLKWNVLKVKGPNWHKKKLGDQSESKGIIKGPKWIFCHFLYEFMKCDVCECKDAYEYAKSFCFWRSYSLGFHIFFVYIF